MGVGGYHTMQEIETLRVKGLKYNPDLVLVTLCLNDFDLRSDGGVHKTLLERSRVPTRTTSTESYARLLQISRVAFIIHHRLRYSQTAYEDFYAKNILKGQTTVRAGFALLSELRQRHGFSALVTILPVFVDPFDKYKYTNIHEKVFQAAEGLPRINVIDLLPSFARLDNSAEKFSYDGLHLNEHGHQAMAEILLPIIESRSRQLQ
jgi:lysophospholipase L1-like esterase